MSVEYPQEFIDYVKDKVTYLTGEIYLGGYWFGLEFSPEPSKDDTSNSTVAAEIAVNSRYLSFEITIFPHLLEKWKNEKYESVGLDLIHEVCHVLIEPVARWARADLAPSHEGSVMDAVEQQTQKIARTLHDLLPEDWYMPKEEVADAA